MGEYYKLQFIENKDVINNSCDPHEIMRVVFKEQRTQYSDELESIAASRMKNLVRHDDTQGYKQGLLVIHAVLDMMRGTEQVQSHQKLGCEIFWSMSIPDLNSMIPVVFILMLDQIEDAVYMAVSVYSISRVSWIRNANKTLQRIDTLRKELTTH